MDIIIVIGADSSIGVSVCRKFIGLGYRVYGVGDDFSKSILTHKYFHPVKCAIGNKNALMDFIKYIQVQHGGVCGLAFVVPVIEEGSADSIIQQHLGAPALLCEHFLPSISRQQGIIMAIISQPSEGSTIGYMVEGGLDRFLDGIFEQYRDKGVRVTTMRVQNSQKGKTKYSLLDPDLVAEAVENILRFKEGNTVRKVLIEPQTTGRESDPISLERPISAYNALVVSEQPAVEPPIPTVLPVRKPGLKRYENTQPRYSRRDSTRR